MEEMDTESRQQKAAMHIQDDTQQQTFTFVQFLRQRELFMPLIIACALQVVQQLSGINAVRFGLTSLIIILVKMCLILLVY